RWWRLLRGAIQRTLNSVHSYHGPTLLPNGPLEAMPLPQAERMGLAMGQRSIWMSNACADCISHVLFARGGWAAPIHCWPGCRRTPFLRGLMIRGTWAASLRNWSDLAESTNSSWRLC